MSHADWLVTPLISMTKQVYGDGGGMSIKRTISKEDRTEHWLMLVVHFGESWRTKAYVLSNELAAPTAWSLRTDEKKPGDSPPRFH